VKRSWLGEDLSISDPARLGQGLASQLGIATVLDFLKKTEILDRDNCGDRFLAAA